MEAGEWVGVGAEGGAGASPVEVCVCDTCGAAWDAAGDTGTSGQCVNKVVACGGIDSTAAGQ